MTAIEMPLFIVFFVGAAIAMLLPKPMRSIWCVAVPVVSAFLLLFSGISDSTITVSIVGLELIVHRADKLTMLFAYVFHIAALLGAIFAWYVDDAKHSASSLIYAGSAVGSVFSGDLVTLFLFWEIMAFSSAYLIWARRTPTASRAVIRYLMIQIVSGLLLLGGAVLYFLETGTIEFTYIGLTGTASFLIFLAFGIKCAFPLLHNWLTDTYPEATPAGTVFLSAFTTKVAVYCLARGFPGTESLIYIGAVMTCFPIFFAVIENDLRRVLAYSMINQVGFMVCGIGIGTALAINGAVAHAFNDVIFKGLLMMTMGAVLYRTGKMNGSDLGGLYKSMPYTTGFCIVGAASISAFPLFSGFISKSIITSAALEEGRFLIWTALLFASAGVFHHAGIKIPFFAFFAHDSGIRVKEAPTSMLIAMGIAAFLCIGIGSFPQYLYALLPFEMHYEPFHASHVLAQIQLLLFSALAFVWLKLSGIYPPELRGTNIDAEWIYRKGFPVVYRWTCKNVSAGLHTVYRSLIGSIKAILRAIDESIGESSSLSGTWTVDAMVATVLVLFGLLLIYLFQVY